MQIASLNSAIHVESTHNVDGYDDNVHNTHNHNREEDKKYNRHNKDHDDAVDSDNQKAQVDNDNEDVQAQNNKNASTVNVLSFHQR